MHICGIASETCSLGCCNLNSGDPFFSGQILYVILCCVLLYHFLLFWFSFLWFVLQICCEFFTIYISYHVDNLFLFAWCSVGPLIASFWTTSTSICFRFLKRYISRSSREHNIKFLIGCGFLILVQGQSECKVKWCGILWWATQSVYSELIWLLLSGSTVIGFSQQ